MITLAGVGVMILLGAGKVRNQIMAVNPRKAVGWAHGHRRRCFN